MLKNQYATAVSLARYLFSLNKKKCDNRPIYYVMSPLKESFLDEDNEDNMLQMEWSVSEELEATADSPPLESHEAETEPGLSAGQEICPMHMTQV